MTDEDIQKAWRDIGGADGRMILPLYEFARAIIAQARAELKPVAYLMREDIDELRKTGRHAVVIYSESISPLDVPLAIIPNKD